MPLLSRDVVSFNLPLVAALAEVGVSPAEPLGYGAAELAFELYVVRSMGLAVLNTGAYTHGRALTAHQLLRLILLSFLLRVDAVLHTSEVCALTLEALVVSKLEHSPLLQIVIESVIRVLESLVFIQVLEFRPFDGLSYYFFFDLPSLCELIVQHRTVWSLYPRLTLSAVEEVEDYSGAGPPLLDALEEAVNVEDVPTFGLHARRLLESFDEAETTVVISSLSLGRSLILGNTGRVQAGKTYCLPFEAAAGMPAAKDAVARLAH